MLVFFALGLGGDVRSMTHWGVGGDSDGDPCAIMVYVADLRSRLSNEQQGRIGPSGFRRLVSPSRR